jgi:hypothetical protein
MEPCQQQRVLHLVVVRVRVSTPARMSHPPADVTGTRHKKCDDDERHRSQPSQLWSSPLKCARNNGVSSVVDISL